MRTFKTEMTERKVVDSVMCNKCGKFITSEECVHVEQYWGYNSPWDTEVHEFDLCIACYTDIVASFQKPVSIGNYSIDSGKKIESSAC